ncbi:MAG: methyltransferase [Candidatus Bathyarchaeota archaeon]|nr:methyltransferase [Candidatus Bathyarchaeota archaeon]
MTEDKTSAEHYFSATPKSKAHLGVIRTKLRGKQFEFLTASTVFSKKRVDTGTRLLIENMILPETGRILDIGCGYGAVGIVAAAFKPQLHVVMTDVNTRAVELADHNIRKNRTPNAEARSGYLYEPVKDLTFNCVLSNPPVSAGMQTVKAIITEAPKAMADQATLQMVVRSKIGGKTLPTVFNETFGNCTVLARESGYRVLIGQKLKTK